MISRLRNGSILIETEEEALPSKEKTAEKAFDDFTCGHGMIFHNNRIYHSSSGERQSGVRSHTLQQFLDASEGQALGAVVALDCPDETLRNLFIQTMSRWDPVELLEQLRRQPRTEGKHKAIKLPTPFLDFVDRVPDPPEQSEKCELYRAIRAYMRNQVNPPQPLSAKGVSCGNFIAYSFKAAIVQSIFPDGLPKAILAKMQKIEEMRQENKAARAVNQPVVKLSDIGATTNLLDELMQLVTNHLSPELQDRFEFLKTPVKYQSVGEICRQAVKFPTLWKVQGAVFLYEDKEQNVPYVMDYQAYKMVSKASAQQQTHPLITLPTNTIDEVVNNPVKKAKHYPEAKGFGQSFFNRARPGDQTPDDPNAKIKVGLGRKRG